MPETINFPRYAAHQAQMKLERAEALIDSLCEIYDAVAGLFARGVPAAKDSAALTIRRAWLRASA